MISISARSRWRCWPVRDDIMAPTRPRGRGVLVLAVAVLGAVGGVLVANSSGTAPAPAARGVSVTTGKIPTAPAKMPPSSPSVSGSPSSAPSTSASIPKHRTPQVPLSPGATVTVTVPSDPQVLPGAPRKTVTLPAPAPKTVTVTVTAQPDPPAVTPSDPAHGKPTTSDSAPTASPTAPAPTPSATASAEPAPVAPVPAVEATHQPAPKPPVVGFLIASFNILGASHTGPGADQHPTWSSGVPRMAGMLRTLLRHHVDVAGRRVGFAQYPSPNSGGDNRIVWRTEVFTAVKKTGFSTPYFNGHMTRMPVVLLRHRATGQEVWVISIHNPAETARFHHQGAWRARSVAMERAEVRTLQQSGHPVFLTGDFNDHGGAFCPLTKGGLVTAAAGGRHVHGCRVPARSQIDWIFRSRGTVFSHYRIDSLRTHRSQRPRDRPRHSQGPGQPGQVAHREALYIRFGVLGR